MFLILHSEVRYFITVSLTDLLCVMSLQQLNSHTSFPHATALPRVPGPPRPPHTHCTPSPGEGCRSKTFVPDDQHAVCVDWQRIRLQELVGAESLQKGEVRGRGFDLRG